MPKYIPLGALRGRQKYILNKSPRPGLSIPLGLMLGLSVQKSNLYYCAVLYLKNMMGNIIQQNVCVE